MAEISVLIEGGKATAGAPLGPALGPLGVNIGEIVLKINEKTKNYVGMKVPVTVEVDSKKQFQITVGSPPTSALIIKELNVQKGGSNQKTEKIGDLSMQQVKKLAEMKLEALTSTSVFAASREIIGTCNSMAVYVEGKPAKEMQKEIQAGNWNGFFGVKEEQTAVGKAEKAVEKAVHKIVEVVREVEEEIKEEVEEVLHPRASENENARKNTEKEMRREAPSMESGMRKIGVPAIAKAQEMKKAPAEKPVQKAEAPEEKAGKPQKESYMQHMKKIEQEVGIAKKQAGAAKKVEVEVTKGRDADITRPKKK